MKEGKDLDNFYYSQQKINDYDLQGIFKFYLAVRKDVSKYYQ
jgi:hypothetical protein